MSRRIIEPPSQALIDTHEAARQLGVTNATVRHSRASGTLMGRPAPEHLKFGTRTVRYRQATLDAWIAGAQIRTRIHDNEEEEEETAQ